MSEDLTTRRRMCYIGRGEIRGSDAALNLQFATECAPGFATMRSQKARSAVPSRQRVFCCADRGNPGVTLCRCLLPAGTPKRNRIRNRARIQRSPCRRWGGAIHLRLPGGCSWAVQQTCCKAPVRGKEASQECVAKARFRARLSGAVCSGQRASSRTSATVPFWQAACVPVPNVPTKNTGCQYRLTRAALSRTGKPRQTTAYPVPQMQKARGKAAVCAGEATA